MWKLPKSLFAVQQQVYTRLRMHTQLLQNASDETQWTDTRKQQIRKAKAWFEEQTRFKPPGCANEVYRKALGAAEDIPVPRDESGDNKRTNEEETAPEAKRPRGKGEDVSSPFLLT